LAEEEDNQDIVERIVVIPADNKAKDIIVEDKVLLEDVCVSALVEYQFDNNGKWHLSQMSLSPMESYRGSKFKHWEHMLIEPDCEAAFKRLLKLGVINKLFDPIAFPSPQEEKEQYQVRDEHGKIVEIPRPVHALRIWNAKLRKYDILSAHLDGAPSDKDAADYWKNMLQKLRDMRGAEYIDGLMEEINSS